MNEERDEKPRLVLEDLAPVVLDLASQRELPTLIARFLDLVRTWAAPSAVIAAVKEPESERGWRLLPALTLGSVPLGIERSLSSLVEDTPACLVRPTIFRPKEDVAGVKPRDNCIVPWWCEGQSGLLLLRGVPRPYPANLGDALAMASAPLWPRLLGGPASRVEALVEELRGLSQKLQQESARQLERLRVARPEEPAAGRVEPAPDAGRLAALEQELRAAREQAQRATRTQAELTERLAGFETAAGLTRSERDEARAEARRLAARLETLEAEREAEHTEAQKLSSRIQALESERASGGGTEVEQRRATEASLAKARAAEEALLVAQRELAASRALGDPRELAERAAGLEAALEATRTERDHAKVEADRLTARVEPLQSERAAAEERSEQLRHAAEASEARARAAEEALGTAQEALAAAQKDAGQARAGTEQADTKVRELSQRWDGSLGALRVALAALRRAAFVPPGLRLSMEDASALVEEGRERPAPWVRVALLDRDPVGLEELAEELEGTGIEMKIANYPEELGLLLRTPGARDLAAIICDVMAFRPDQNVAGLFRSWDKDRPGLAYYLSYNPESSGETDRARRVPQSLTVGHLARPLAKARLVEALETLARKKSQP